MTRVPLIVGNWKMNVTNHDAVRLVRALLAARLARCRCEVILCPPFTALGEVALLLAGSSIGLGAQNLHWQRSGAFTGEISAAMLASVSCTHVLIGHSERRSLFGESDDTVSQKMRSALGGSLVPILCIGETLEQRQSDRTTTVVEAQLSRALEGLRDEDVGSMVVAYEPVWAIGSGKTASPEQAQEVHAGIRSYLTQRWNQSAATVRILYGGSVTAENASRLLEQPDIDGALVGGASLEPDSFTAIVEAAGAAGARH